MPANKGMSSMLTFLYASLDATFMILSKLLLQLPWLQDLPMVAVAFKFLEADGLQHKLSCKDSYQIQKRLETSSRPNTQINGSKPASMLWLK